MNKRGIKREILVVLLVITLFVNILFISAGELSVTNEHPFLINGNWVEASDLVVGDLMTTVDGRLARITGVRDVRLRSPVKVFNIEASVFHDFVVGDDGLVVHNSNSVRTIGQWKNYEPIRPLYEVEGYIDSERIIFSEELIGKSRVTPEIRAAILKAHAEENLFTKYRTLEGAGLNSFEINLLLRNKVCGGEDIKSTSFFSRFSKEIEIISQYNDLNRKAGQNCLTESSKEYRDAINTILKHPDLDSYLIAISKKYRDLSQRDTWYALEDTLQDAKMGMYKGIGTFDAEKGAFSTHMGNYMEGYMIDSLRKTGDITGTSLESGEQSLIYKYIIDIIEDNPKATRSEILGILKSNYGSEHSPRTFETVIEKYFQKRAVVVSGDAPIKLGSETSLRSFIPDEEVNGLDLIVKKLDQDIYQKIIVELDGDIGRWVPIDSDRTHIMLAYKTTSDFKPSRYVCYIKETGDVIKGDFILYDDLRGIMLIEKNTRYQTASGHWARRNGDFQVIHLDKYLGDYRKGTLRIRGRGDKGIDLYKYSTNLPGHIFNSKSGTLYVRMGNKNPRNYCGFTEIKDYVYDIDKGIILFKFDRKYYAVRVLGIDSKVPMSVRSLIGIIEGRVFYDIPKNKMIIIKKTGSGTKINIEVSEPKIEFYSDIYGIDSRIVVFKDSSGIPKFYINGESSAINFNKNSKVYQTIYNPETKQVLVYSTTNNDYKILPVEFYDIGKNMLFYKNDGIWYVHWVQKKISVRQQLPYRFSTMKYNRENNHLKLGTEFIDEYGRRRVYNTETQVFEIDESYLQIINN